jgi:hypothetical protein
VRRRAVEDDHDLVCDVDPRIIVIAAVEGSDAVTREHEIARHVGLTRAAVRAPLTVENERARRRRE